MFSCSIVSQLGQWMYLLFIWVSKQITDDTHFAFLKASYYVKELFRLRAVLLVKFGVSRQCSVLICSEEQRRDVVLLSLSGCSGRLYILKLRMGCNHHGMVVTSGVKTNWNRVDLYIWFLTWTLENEWFVFCLFLTTSNITIWETDTQSKPKTEESTWKTWRVNRFNR